MREPAVCVELLALAAEDQAARHAVIDTDDAAAVARVEAADRASSARLKELVDTFGWPGRSLVGRDGAHAAWLLVQHADHDVELQRRCLVLLEAAVAADEADPADYAYLYDRVAVADGRAQRYGTQYVDGKPRPIEDVDALDERRHAVGLEPFAEYDTRMRELWGRR